MRLILLAAVLVASMAVGAEGRVTAYSPLIEPDDAPYVFDRQSRLFPHVDHPDFLRRTFEAVLSVEWNGVSQPTANVWHTFVVAHELGRRNTLTTIPLIAQIGLGHSQFHVESYGDKRALIAIDNGTTWYPPEWPDGELLGYGYEDIKFRVGFFTDEGGSIYDTLVQLPAAWDTPATIDERRRLNRGAVGPPCTHCMPGEYGDTWQLSRLSGISGPWEEVDLVLFDGFVAGDHFTVTLDRFGWQAIDELIVGMERRGAVRRSRDVLPAAGTLGVAAVPEPSTWMLALAIMVLPIWRHIRWQ